MIVLLLILQVTGAILVTEYTTLRDVVKWRECKTLTAEEINTFLDPYHCRGFKAECLKQFDLTEINGACKDHLMFSEVKKLPALKLHELISSENVANISCLTNNLLDFVEYFEFFPATYAYYCSHDEHWRSAFAKAINKIGVKENTPNPIILEKFLEQSQNIPQLGREFFTALDTDIRDSVFTAKVIPLLTKEQFGYLRISEWTSAKIKSVPPEYMENYANSRAIPYMTVASLNSLSVEQVSNWGESPSKLPSKGRFARRTFYLGHPCTYLKTILDRFQDDNVVKAITERCKPLWRQLDFLKADIRQRNYRRWNKDDFFRA